MIPDSVQISVKNFKSLRDFSTDLKKFNVLIGPNGSGKTNVLELFTLATLCISPSTFPPRPFSPWWNYGNVVWVGDESLSIQLEIEVIVESYKIKYGMQVSGIGGNFIFLEEYLHIPNYLRVKRTPTSAQYILSKRFLTKVERTLKPQRYGHLYTDRLPKQPWTIDVSESESFFRKISLGHIVARKLFLRDIIPSRNKDHFPISVPSPAVSGRNGSISVERYIAGMFNDSVVLIRQLDYNAIRQPTPVNHPTILKENGAGLINLLFNWYISSDRIPERIKQALDVLFPKWSIVFKLTDDGRIMMRVNDGNTELAAPSIPDGFYKLLTILTAIELNPRFLLIDEMDTSLHAKIIEYVIDELKTCNANVIITTHSPAVIDMVDIDDLILLERSNSGTTSRRIDNPSKLDEELRASGLTVSEKLLYGRI